MDHLPGVPQTVQESRLEGEGPMREIPLTQGKIALVDDEDFERVNQFKWYAQKTTRRTWYAARHTPCISGKRSIVYLHGYILDPPNGMVIDHINGDGLNNQRGNMRIVTQRQNLQNRHHPKSSIYVGVYWNKKSRKWQAQIQIKGKIKYLGLFDNEIAAAEAYTSALINI